MKEHPWDGAKMGKIRRQSHAGAPSHGQAASGGMPHASSSRKASLCSVLPAQKPTDCGVVSQKLQHAQKFALMQTENPRIFWPDSGFYAYEGRYTRPRMQRCIGSFSRGSPARASDFVYVNKSKNVAHLSRRNQRRKLVHLVNLARFERFWDCVLNLF